MAKDQTASVGVVGGGPVGLSLALDLAARGINVIVAERRAAREPPSVKCNHVSSRTMEIFRRLGIADEVRNAGLPDDYPNDVVFRTRATGYELARIPIPCRLNRRSEKNVPDGWWPTPEPPHRINQLFLEPVLFDQALARSRITILNRCEITSIAQTNDNVTANARDLDCGESFRIECSYLIGCDGGRSTIRRQIGAKLEGDEVIQRVQSSYIRAPQLMGRIKGERAWMSYIYNPQRAGNLLAIDGRETWLIHNYLRPGEEFDTLDRDACLRLLLGVGPEFEYEMLGNEDWIGRRLVADKFRDRRVFICGDAAHIWVPYAGYGMNTGIADAMNLSWLLAAHLNGWAPASILDAHERERWPITEQVSRFAMRHAEGAIRERTTLPPELEDASEAGAAARRVVGEAAYHLHVQQFACAGLNYGYFYDDSPIIAHDGERAPSYTMYDYTPSTVPGCRTPHYWLSDGQSLYDAMGGDYALIRLDRNMDVAPILSAAQQRGVPLGLIEASGEIPSAFRNKLVLSRPDNHVAWRGDQVPKDPLALIDLIRGA